MSMSKVQQILAGAGFYTGKVDGLYGPKTEAALRAAVGDTKPEGAPEPIHIPSVIAWGAKVSDKFRVRVVEIAARIGVSVDDLMTCMAWESGRTFSPSVKNMAGSGATGLIQFMPTTARALGTTVENLALMTAEKQLDWVQEYFMQPMFRGRLKNLGDLYMAILWPAAVGQGDGFVLWDSKRKPTTYRQNAGLDVNRDGVITRGEAMAKVRPLLAEGLRPGNVWAA